MNASFAFLIALVRATCGFLRRGFLELSSPRPVGWPGKLGDVGGVAGVRDASLQWEYEFFRAKGLLMAFGGLQVLRPISIACTINARDSLI